MYPEASSSQTKKFSAVDFYHIAGIGMIVLSLEALIISLQLQHNIVVIACLLYTQSRLRRRPRRTVKQANVL